MATAFSEDGGLWRGGVTIRRSAFAAAVVVVVGCVVWWRTEPSTPSCSYPVRVTGEPSSHTVGLVRCYLSSLAHDDARGLSRLMVNPPPMDLPVAKLRSLGLPTGRPHITSKDLTHARDAASGTAAAEFSPNEADPNFENVTITFADGATEYIGLQDMGAFGDSESEWRIDLGTYPK